MGGDTCSINCFDSPGQIPSYGDIGGLGAMLGFLVTAGLIVVFVAGYYATVFDPELDPYRSETGKNVKCEYPNPVDRVFLYVLRQFFKALLQKLSIYKVLSVYLRNDNLGEALTKCAKMFSDIQILTGVAVLIGGYKAFACGLSLYHWQLVIYQAWLTTVTHATILSFLRTYLLNHRQHLLWRFGGMSIIIVMLLVAIILTPRYTWDSTTIHEAGQSAICYLHYTVEQLFPGQSESSQVPNVSESLESRLKVMFFLAYGYTMRILKLFRGFDRRPRYFSFKLRLTMNKVRYGGRGRDKWNPRHITSLKQGIWVLFLDPLVIAGCCILHIHIDLLTSFLGEVFWLVVSFIWVTKRLFTTRSFGPKDENDWTFGQVVPLVLLVAPIVNLIEHLSRTPDESMSDEISSCTIDTQDLESEGSGEDQYQQTVDDWCESYESSNLFRGAFALAAMSYLQLAAFFLITDLSGISFPFATFTFFFLVISPMLQATWILYAAWVPELELRPSRARFLLYGTFMVPAYTSLLDSIDLIQGGSAMWTSREEYSSFGGVIVVASDYVKRTAVPLCSFLLAYLVMMACFTLNDQLQRHLLGYKGVVWRLCLHSPSIVLSILLPVVAITISHFALDRPYLGHPYQSIFSRWHTVALLLGVVLALQSLVQLFEVWDRRYSPRAHDIMRVSLYILTMAGPAIIQFIIRSHVDEFLFCVLISCPVWAIAWSVSDAFREWRWSLADELRICDPGSPVPRLGLDMDAGGWSFGCRRNRLA